jgi:hypothetical protein
LKGRCVNEGQSRAGVNRPRRGVKCAPAAWFVCRCLLLYLAGLPLSAAEVDTSKLPPPAAIQIDFSRDVKPILDVSCIRCHGPVKPKSGFRLDGRDSALKGGDNGVDILPGNSTNSPLIHYIAYLVPDMEMPPPDKGRQLTPAQVGMLRAWIDEGLPWDSAPTATNITILAPTVGGTIVRGDSHKFQEHYWQKSGPNGGLDSFELFDQPSPDTKTLISGHVLVDDYKITLAMDKSEFGFIHSGWQQYRKYYDDTGGYLPGAGPSMAPNLGRDLYLDIGKAWIDFGLTLPDWPRMVLGYEYDYKQGDEAITSWGAFGQGATERNLAPASKDIQEQVNIIKFDLEDEIKGVTIEDRFRGEFYRLNTQGTNEAARGPVSYSASEGNNYFEGANTIRLEKQLAPWLFCSAGYLYSKLNSDASFTDSTTFLTTPYLAQISGITLEKDSHVFNVNGIAGPFDGLTMSGGAQSEWTHQDGFGSGNLNNIAYTANSPVTLAINPATLSSDYDQNTVSETLGLRYGLIPFTVLFADARGQQETISQTDSDIQPNPAPSFIEDPSFTSQSYDARVGFNTSPWRSVSLSAHYRRYDDDSRYQTNGAPQPPGGYPGFIRERYVLTDEAEGKLVLRPCSWSKTTITYQWLTTDYRDDTAPAFNAAPFVLYSQGGELLAGRYRSEVYSVNETLTPCSRLFLGATFSYQPTTITTATADFAAIAPYRGEIYSVLADGTYIFNPDTDLSASYSFSKADYGQDNAAAGLPVGIQYQQHAAQIGLTRRLGQNLSARLQYGFYYYSEPSSGGADNYSANAIFATVTWRLP